MNSRTSMNFLTASLEEFISVWRMGGNSSLHLTTSSGQVNIGFNLQLGHPDFPFPPHSAPPFPPSQPTPHFHPSPSPRPRHRGPVQREKNRLRAALHQAAHRQTLLAGPPSTPPPPVTEQGSPPSPTSPTTAPVVTSPTMVSASVPIVSLPADTPSVPVVTSPVLSTTSSAASAEPVKSAPRFKCDYCDFKHETEKLVINHMDSIHKELKCNYCGLKITSFSSMNTHIQSAHKKFQQPSSAYSLSMPPLHKQDFTYAHPPYEATFNKCLLRGIGCTGTAVKYFTSVKVVVNSQRENQKHIYTCESCMRYIPIEEQDSKPSRPVSKKL